MPPPLTATPTDSEQQQQQQQQHQTTEAHSSPLTELPDDVLLTIFTLAADQSPDSCLRLVCKRFNDAVMSCNPTELKLQGHLPHPLRPPCVPSVSKEQLGTLARMVARHASVNTLNMAFMTGSEVVAALQPLGGAQQQHVRELRVIHSDLSHPLFLSTFRNSLESLQMRDFVRDWSMAVSRMPQLHYLNKLQQLELHVGQPRRGATCPTLMVPDLDHLTRLRIVNDPSVVGGGYVHVCSKSLTSLTKLEVLEIVQCARVQVAPLAHLLTLQRLRLEDTNTTDNYDMLAALTNLTHLHLSGASFTINSTFLTSLNGLLELEFDLRFVFCTEECLRAVGSLAQLQWLHMLGSVVVTSLQPLTSLEHLHHLRLASASATPLEPLSRLQRLQVVEVSACSDVQSLAPLNSLTQLRQLSLGAFRTIGSLLPLTALQSLTWLELKGPSDVATNACWPYLPKMVQLQHLAFVSGLLATVDLGALRRLTRLTFLGGISVRLNQSLPSLPSLEDLDLRLHDGDCNCQTFAALTSLTKLRLLDTQLSTLDSLRTLTSLRHLDISRCLHVSCLQPLECLAHLTQLRLQRCSRVSELGPLSSLRALQRLDVSFCDAVHDLQPLFKLPRLRHLNMLACSIPDEQLRALSQLRELNAFAGDVRGTLRWHGQPW